MSEQKAPVELETKPSQLLIADALPEDAERIRRRIRALLREELWVLEEACWVCFGVMPVPGLTWLTPRDRIRASLLLDYALGGIEAETLKIRKVRKGLFQKTLLVDPYEFGAWVAAKPHIVGPARAAIIAKLLTRTVAQQLKAQTDQQQVLNSGFSTPSLNAAFAAIVKFWLPHSEGAPNPTKDTIEEWLVENHQLKPTAAAEIARIINPHPGTTESKKK